MTTKITADDRILVTGAAGFLGSHIVPALRKAFPGAALLTVGRKDYDLLNQAAATQMFADLKPTIVVHLAAKIGGILANRSYPADFCYENLLSTVLVFEADHRAGARKLIGFMGGCSYPATARSPIAEDQFWQGYPQPESTPIRRPSSCSCCFPARTASSTASIPSCWCRATCMASTTISIWKLRTSYRR